VTVDRVLRTDSEGFPGLWAGESNELRDLLDVLIAGAAGHWSLGQKLPVGRRNAEHVIPAPPISSRQCRIVGLLGGAARGSESAEIMISNDPLMKVPGF
jgi:hypothetical protein